MLYRQCVLAVLGILFHASLGVVNPVDLFGNGDNEWYLAFRGTASIEHSVYDAYLKGSDNVPDGCKQTSQALPCSSHYRSSILDNWKNIEEIAFVIYKNQTIQKYAVFDGSGTDNKDWFSARKLKRSSWSDLKGNPEYVSIEGDDNWNRRFFINHHYGGCNSDAGWFVAIDKHNHPCHWEDGASYPLFVYATGDSYENWDHGHFAQADVMAIYVKYGQPEEVAFVDLFGSDQQEWRIVFRGTSHINKSAYDAYFHGSQYVDWACKQTDGTIPCSNHYRSSLMDDWTNIEEVAFVVFNAGVMKQYVVFDGAGTTNVNWFSGNKLKRSSWTDLKGNQQYISIGGDDYQDRRFFINDHYGGCDKDGGWFVVADKPHSSCDWENVHPTYPRFLYSASSTKENWSRGQAAEADVIAIFVKFGTQGIVVG